jgi:hypothetical protein
MDPQELDAAGPSTSRLRPGERKEQPAFRRCGVPEVFVRVIVGVVSPYASVRRATMSPEVESLAVSARTVSRLARRSVARALSPSDRRRPRGAS